jgi:isoleucyl-tRNA synthetase
VRGVCSTALGLRKGNGLRVRQPLPALTVVTPEAGDLQAFAGLVADEVNVKDVRLVDLGSAAEAEFGVTQRLVVNARAAGPRLGKDVQTAIRAAREGDWTTAPDGTVTAGGVALAEGEYEVQTVVAGDGDGTSATAALPGAGFVVLDTSVSPELAAEGLARDVVRVVQQARRDAGLDIGDRIRLTVVGDQPVWAAVVAHQDLVVSETLADSFGAAGDLDRLPPGDGVAEATVGDGLTVRVKVERL